jgi:hypothetical protein
MGCSVVAVLGSSVSCRASQRDSTPEKHPAYISSRSFKFQNHSDIDPIIIVVSVSRSVCMQSSRRLSVPNTPIPKSKRTTLKDNFSHCALLPFSPSLA